MNTGEKLTIQTSGGADLAFAVVVMTSYFVTFSGIKDASALKIFLLILLGIAYITIGIYGFAISAKSANITIKLAYFMVQYALGGAIVALTSGAGFNALVLLPLAGHSVMMLTANWTIVANFGLILTYIIAAQSFTPTWTDTLSGLPNFLAGQIFIIAFTSMAVSEQKARKEVESLVIDLERANNRLREYAQQVEELAVTKERNRLAREIHDGLGHFLTTLYMQIQAARAVMMKKPEQAEHMLDNAQRIAQQTLREVRNSVADLRDDRGEIISLNHRIREVLEIVSVSGVIKHAFTMEGQPRVLSVQAELTLLRCAQEGINNALKHGKPGMIKVMLDYSTPKKTFLWIEDDGMGAQSLQGGFGLIGLKERVNLLNGEFCVETEVGKGFKLRIMVPE